MKISPKQIQAILALPRVKRYSHFIKVAADRRMVWGLRAQGWALAKTEEGKQVFPVWPAREYAQLCANGCWDGYCSAAPALHLDGRCRSAVIGRRGV